jgi:hypothetical protein
MLLSPLLLTQTVTPCCCWLAVTLVTAHNDQLVVFITVGAFPPGRAR